MQRIIGIHSKKEGGKTTLAKAAMKFYKSQGLSCKIYSFADGIKRFAIDIMGLDEKLVYGSNDDKETITDYRWIDMPHYPRLIKDRDDEIEDNRARLASGKITQHDFNSLYMYLFNKYVGKLSIRNVLQEVGTGIGRCMYENIWVDAAIRKIKNEGKDVAIIDDVRFSNEFLSIKNFSSDSKVIRLTRAPHKTLDQHASETALDGCKDFNYVLDNENLSKKESVINLISYLEAI